MMICRSKYEAVLFDLDGTLVDSIADLSEAVNYSLRLRGFPSHSVGECRTMVGSGVRNLVRLALPEGFRQDDSCVEACLADFREYYSSHILDRTVPYQGIPELLNDLNAAGVRLAVVSNKFQEGVCAIVRSLFPEICFSAVLGNVPGRPLKPDPSIVGEALRTLAFPPERCAMAGDSQTDMMTACNASIDAIAVGWGYRPLQQVLADFPQAAAAPDVQTLRRLLLG